MSADGTFSSYVVTTPKDKGVTLKAIKIQLEKLAVFNLAADGEEEDDHLYD